MITNTINVVRYLVSGTSYAITYGYWDKDEIKVYLTKADNTLQELELDTDYTLTTANGTSGTLTKVSDWGTATKITILREVEITQKKDLVNGQTIDAESIEDALDHAIAAIQQIQEENSRSLKTAVDEEGLDIVFPNTEARKGTGSGTVICFDSTGKTIVLRDLAGFDKDVATTQANANLAVASAQAAASSESNAKTSETNAKTSETNAKESETKAKTSETNAETSEENALKSEEKAKTYMENTQEINELASEYARGKKIDGTDVSSDEPGYKDNSKYYKEQAATSASDAQGSKEAAASSASSASSSASSAEEAYQKAHAEGISNIISHTSDGYTIITVIQRDGTSNSFSVSGGKGDKGDKGDAGEGGVVAPINSFFTLSVDADGNLWVNYSDDDNPPNFYYDSETGNLYIDT